MAALDRTLLTDYLHDLQSLQVGADKLTRLSQAGSVLDKAISLAVSVIDAMRSVALGVAWRMIVKVVPLIAIIYDNIINIQQASRQLAAPLTALRSQLPAAIIGVEAQEAGQTPAAGFSGHLYALSTAMPEVVGGLRRFGGLVDAARQAIAGLAGLWEKLSAIKGVSPLADRLAEALGRLDTSLGESQITIGDVADALQRTQGWLPSYQAQARQPVSASVTCQAVAKSSLFKKELCQRPVTSFDDEAAPTCAACRITVCDQHRVAQDCPAGSMVRHTWLCLECNGKQHR